MSIHEHLPPQARWELKQVGWTKGGRAGETGAEGRPGLRLCNLVAQSPRDATGSVQTRSRKELTGIDSEPAETVYSKFYKSQISVIEQAIESAG